MSDNYLGIVEIKNFSLLTNFEQKIKQINILLAM